MKKLESRITTLEKKAEMMKTSLAEEEKKRVIVLRTISREQAKQEALGLFRKGEPLLYADVAQRLRIGLAEAVEICEELIAEGEVTLYGNSDQTG